MAFKKVEVSLAPFIGWGDGKKHRGQHVTGWVMKYDVTGGKDFNGDVCPRIEVELTEQAASFKLDEDDDTKLIRTNHQAGERVALTVGSKNLQWALEQADEDYNGLRGRLVKIVMVGELALDGRRKAKQFEVLVDDTQTRKVKGSSDDDAGFGDADDSDDEPPF